jgi:SagB-type dehydrogenase family enzyme
MKKLIFCGLLIFNLLLAGKPAYCTDKADSGQMIDLPEIHNMLSDIILEKAIISRRSVRSFAEQELSLDQIGKLLWAAQGITDPKGYRTTPSPGALYPLELYVVAEKGFYKYIPQGHKLKLIDGQDYRSGLSKAAFSQPYVAGAAIDIVICSVYDRVTKSYGDRGIRFAHIEAGHVGQNIHLQAVALGLGSISVGAFVDQDVQNLLPIPDDHKPVYIIPVGYPKK